MSVDFTNLSEVLLWLTGVGSPYIIGRVIAFLAENWKQWHSLPRTVKFIAPLLVSVALSVGATLFMGNTVIVETLSPQFAMVMTAVLTYLGTQEGYMAARKSDYGSSAKL